MRTRTWPGPGVGAGTSRTCSTSSGSPQRSHTTAFMPSAFPAYTSVPPTARIGARGGGGQSDRPESVRQHNRVRLLTTQPRQQHEGGPVLGAVAQALGQGGPRRGAVLAGVVDDGTVVVDRGRVGAAAQGFGQV